MKNILCSALALASIYGLAQPPSMPGPTGKDRMQVLGVGQMPLPLPKAELLKMQSASTMRADDGFSTAEKSPERVRQFINDLEIVTTHQSSHQEMEFFAEALKQGKTPAAPMVVRDINALRLTFPTVIARTGTFMGAVPQGTLVDGAWTGVQRYFHIAGAGHARISETDMGATGGMFYMNKAAINTTMAGKPAISMVFTDDHGQRIEEVLWVDGTKLYTVSFAPEMHKGRHGPMKTNANISAFSLAGELR